MDVHRRIEWILAWWLQYHAPRSKLERFPAHIFHWISRHMSETHLVFEEIRLRLLASFAHQDTIIRSKTAVNDTRARVKAFNLLVRSFVHQDRSMLLLRDDHNTVLAANAKCGVTVVVDSIERIFNLKQLSRRVERRQTKRVRRVAHRSSLRVVSFKLSFLAIIVVGHTSSANPSLMKIGLSFLI